MRWQGQAAGVLYQKGLVGYKAPEGSLSAGKALRRERTIVGRRKSGACMLVKAGARPLRRTVHSPSGAQTLWHTMHSSSGAFCVHSHSGAQTLRCVDSQVHHAQPLCTDCQVHDRAGAQALWHTMHGRSGALRPQPPLSADCQVHDRAGALSAARLTDQVHTEAAPLTMEGCGSPDVDTSQIACQTLAPHQAPSSVETQDAMQQHPNDAPRLLDFTGAPAQKCGQHPSRL